jgi:hypothetical protein
MPESSDPSWVGEKQSKEIGTRELVLTLSVPGGEVVKVETLARRQQGRRVREPHSIAAVRP